MSVECASILLKASVAAPKKKHAAAFFAVVVVFLVGTVPVANAATTVITGTTETAVVGSGRADNNHDVTITNGGIDVTGLGNVNAISVGSGGTINITNSTVQNRANGGGGLYGTGPNTIEVGSNYTINIVNSNVSSLGSQNNGEAINLHGGGNIVNVDAGSRVYAASGAAIWFQDETSTGVRNTVDNYGSIIQGRGGNVIGTSGGNGIVFINRTGAQVEGSLLFSHGDDSLTFEGGSTVTGNVDGGGGTNDLTLSGDGTDDTLSGWVRNFSTLDKTGTGTWTISGPLQGFTAVTVDGGTLGLTGNNDGYTGSLVINTAGTVVAQARSLPINNPNTGNVNNVTNDGALIFDQPNDDTYVGQITGTGTVTKTGAGTLTLAPAAAAGNTYSGPTTIQNGVLAINNPNAIGTNQLIVLDTQDQTPGLTATLQTNTSMDLGNRTISVDPGGGAVNTVSGVTYTSGGIIGAGDFSKYGDGMLQVDGAQNPFSNNSDLNVYAGKLLLNGTTTGVGQAVVSGGNLEINGSLTAAGVQVLNDSQLSGVGTINAPVTNAGNITPGYTSPVGIGYAPTEFDTMTINGNYTAQAGSSITFGTELDDGNSNTARLVIDGNVINNGQTVITVNNIGGHGAVTGTAPGDGIQLIEVTGNAPAGSFRLNYDYLTAYGQEAVIGGKYAYHLVESGNDWYLVTARDPGGNPIRNPVIPIYQALPQVLSLFNTMPTLEQRVGHRTWVSMSPTSSYAAYGSVAGGYDPRQIQDSGIWVRAEGSIGHVSPVTNEFRSDFKYNFWRFQAGYDRPLFTASDCSRLVGGINAHVGRVHASLDTTFTGGSIESYGYGVGLSLTWYGKNGFYIDGQAQHSWLSTDIKADVVTDDYQASDERGRAYAASIETGWRFDFSPCWSVTPQAQLAYSGVTFKTFTDVHGTLVDAKNSHALTGRLGLALNRETSFLSPAGHVRRLKGYGIVNLHHHFTEKYSVEVAQEYHKTRSEKTSGSVGLGGTYNWRDDRYSVYGEIGARSSFKHMSDNWNVYGEVGFRFSF